MNMEPFLSLPLIKQNVNPKVWADGKSVGRAQNAIPVVVKLKNPLIFPHQKQYPLKPEVKERLKPIIEILKEQGLLIPCNTPCNTPIFGIKKSNYKWWLVQDLQIINEAVVSLHPVVPKRYTLLSELVEWAKYFSVIDLKDAFYSFSAFGGGKSISICLWRPYTASFSVNLNSFAPGISWQSSCYAQVAKSPNDHQGADIRCKSKRVFITKLKLRLPPISTQQL